MLKSQNKPSTRNKEEWKNIKKRLFVTTRKWEQKYLNIDSMRKQEQHVQELVHRSTGLKFLVTQRVKIKWMTLFLQKQALWTFTTPLWLLTSINVLIFQTKAVWAWVPKRGEQNALHLCPALIKKGTVVYNSLVKAMRVRCVKYTEKPILKSLWMCELHGSSVLCIY